MGLQVTEVQKALKGADYPADREELADLAEYNGNEEVADALRAADGESFGGPAEVMAALKGQLGDEDDDED